MRNSQVSDDVRQTVASVAKTVRWSEGESSGEPLGRQSSRKCDELSRMDEMSQAAKTLE